MSDPDLMLEDCKKVKPIDVSAGLSRHLTKVYDTRNISDLKRVVVHTTDWDVSPEKLAEYDVGPNHISSTGCPAITYHEMVMPDGTVYHTLPFEEVAWHAGPWNRGSVAIALSYRCSNSMGQDQHAPTEKAIKALQCRIGDLCLSLGIQPTEVYGHRELKGTGWFWFKGSKRLRKTCPGMSVDLDQLRHNVALYCQVLLKIRGHYLGKIDADWGPKSRAAFAEYLQG